MNVWLQARNFHILSVGEKDVGKTHSWSFYKAYDKCAIYLMFSIYVSTQNIVF